MKELEHAVSGGHELAVAGVGGLVVLVLWLMLRSQPVSFRLGRLGLPIALLLGYLAIDSLTDILSPTRALRRTTDLISMFMLLLAFGRMFSVLLLDWLMGRRLRREPPRIVREVAEGTLIVVALLITLRAAGVEASSILATSALLTAIIGLSLQDTLGNLFAGLALQAQRTFNVGEWIQLDREGYQLGEIVEINWRATRVRTTDRAELTIPNAQLARSAILNHSRPQRVVRRSVIVQVPYEIAPAQVHAVVLNSVAQVPGVRTDPEPRVITQGFVDVGVQYAVSFYIDDFQQRLELDGAVRDRVWYALQRAGIPISATVHAPPAAPTSALEERLRALRTLDFLHGLPADALESLAADARSERYEPGEIVVRQGERGDQLYVCRSGELVVLHAAADGVRREIARLSAGGMFGELAQLTGEPRKATVQAVTTCDLVVLSKDAFAKVLAKSPELAESISQRMAEREAVLDELDRSASVQEQRDSVTMHQGRFLQRIRDFFALS